MILAAGAVLWRDDHDGRLEFCVVHRPKYDDWSLPKGKLNPGEHVLAAAVREVKEETGHTVALGRPLPTQEYEVAGEPKRVYYWAARADEQAGEWPGTKEIDRIEFLPAEQAIARLTRENDADLVRLLAADPEPTQTMIFLRHSTALPRESWSGPDRDRPLSPAGRAEAEALVPLLAAYGIRTVVTSDAVRCVQTVEPYARATGASVTADRRLAEDGQGAADGQGAVDVVAELWSQPAALAVHASPGAARPHRVRFAVGPGRATASQRLPGDPPPQQRPRGGRAAHPGGNGPN